MKALALVFCLLSQTAIGQHANAQTPIQKAVVGHVLAIKEYSQQGPISEHDPMWRVASVQVLNAPVETIVNVFFSASSDVEWFRFPKLKVGDTGTMLLQQDGPVTGQWLLVKFTPN